jgi:hypothetical protein
MQSSKATFEGALRGDFYQPLSRFAYKSSATQHPIFRIKNCNGAAFSCNAARECNRLKPLPPNHLESGSARALQQRSRLFKLERRWLSVWQRASCAPARARHLGQQKDIFP